MPEPTPAEIFYAHLAEMRGPHTTGEIIEMIREDEAERAEGEE